MSGAAADPHSELIPRDELPGPAVASKATPSDLWYARLRGWQYGATNQELDPDLKEHPDLELRRAWREGHQQGRAARDLAKAEASWETAHYPPPVQAADRKAGG